ncbi:Excinuclease ABC, C subunit-like [hydrothermal vent metagenome]|uniref:Excinuclease ABC, C subunit-like n=1 Tax=hydrothermal vent metagenome TaxID=652676 RepID=A0A3B0U950_9ZZZZ
MKPMFVYILTNSQKTVLYTGVTNDLAQRLVEHYMDRGLKKTFAGRYYCYYLVHFEEYNIPVDAIAREKEIKDWRRSRKEELINSANKNWRFMNNDILDWPPRVNDLYHRGRI